MYLMKISNKFSLNRLIQYSSTPTIHTHARETQRRSSWGAPTVKHGETASSWSQKKKQQQNKTKIKT